MAGANPTVTHHAMVGETAGPISRVACEVYMLMDDYGRAIGPMNKWMAVADAVSAKNHAVRAQVHYELKNFDQALSDVTQAISMRERAGSVPEESWLDLQRYLYFEAKDYRRTIGVVEKLVKHYPKEKWSSHLALLKSQVGE